MTAPDRRTVSLGPGLPRFDLEPLDLPPAPPAPVVCYVCGGRGTRTVDPRAEPWTCNVCQGSGEIGGGR